MHSKAALDSSRHEVLLATGVADSLLYAAAHDFVRLGASLAAYAASGAVNLIGRNEGGLTLSREAADSVLRNFKSYFVPNTRRGNYTATRPLSGAKAIVNMVISDANNVVLRPLESMMLKVQLFTAWLVCEQFSRWSTMA